MKEIRVFRVELDDAPDDFYPYTDESFIKEAERQGFVYSLKGFMDEFNLNEGIGVNSYILITDKY